MTAPTAYRWAGVVAAAAIVLAWAATLAAGLLLPIAEQPGWIALAALQTWLTVGLFITAHDAMHGSLAPAHPRINDALGRLALWCYALFDYRRVRDAHQAHHAHPVSAHDPDFHDGSAIAWYLTFMRRYTTWRQPAFFAAATTALHTAGVPALNLAVMWIAPTLLSSVQLFVFGTYLPHRGDHDEDDPHRATSSGWPRWLSLLTCFHFGYHLEHHRHPGVPWWRLPAVR